MSNEHTEQSERAELKPCPFCGGAPNFIERPDNIDGTEFFCSVACYCGGYSACAHKMVVRKTPELARRDATEKWNTRALLATDKAGGEVVAWLVCSVNKDGSLSLEHAAAWEEAAHEHINDAITEHGIEEAAAWVVRPAYTIHQPQPSALPDDVVKDRDYLAELGFMLEKRGDVWLVIDDCGGEREATLNERVLWDAMIKDKK